MKKCTFYRTVYKNRGVQAVKTEGFCETLTDKNGNITKFHPLLVVDDEWENEFIVNQKIEVCKLYREPYNFKRTGCKGCSLSLDLQEQLEIMERYLPNERKQCEFIWKPIYEEYRRIGYRLKKVETIKLF